MSRLANANHVILSCLMILLLASTTAGVMPPKEPYADVMARIRMLGRGETIARMDKAGKLEKFDELETLGREIERRWREPEPEKYGSAMFELCAVMGSLDLGATAKQHGSATAFAMRALEKADKLPLHVECGLLGLIQHRFDGQGNSLQGTVRAELRKEQTRLLLHAWQRIDKTIDRNWIQGDTGVLNVLPPAETGLRAGVSPDAIKDPKLRAEYEAAIQANREKIARNKQQVQARQLKQDWGKQAQRVIITWYVEAPPANEELAQLLQQYGVDAETRQMIMNAVIKKEIPEELKLVITTQPTPATSPAPDR